MSEHDRHHQHQKEDHDQARKEKKHEEHVHPEQIPPMNIPKLLLVVGVVLTLAVVLVWTLG